MLKTSGDAGETRGMLRACKGVLNGQNRLIINMRLWKLNL